MTKLLEVENLVKRFGGLTATNDLSFHLEDGESLGLIGPNGAGKTTVFSLIMGELQPDAGSIAFGGREISGLPTHERIKAGVSRTYQVPRPFAELDVAENIRVGMMPDDLWAMLSTPFDPDAELALARSVGFNDADFNQPLWLEQLLHSRNVLLLIVLPIEMRSFNVRIQNVCPDHLMIPPLVHLGLNWTQNN